MKKRRLAIIIGHKSTAQGADAYMPMKISEWEFNYKKLWPFIRDHARLRNVDIEVFDKSGMSYQAAGKMVDVWLGGAERKCAIELHFNSATPAAFGSETLVENDDIESKKFAEIIHKRMCECFGRKDKDTGDRGIKKLKSGHRGHYPLLCVKSPVVLVEPAFAGSNPIEATLLWNRKDSFAKCLVDGAIEYLKSS